MINHDKMAQDPCSNQQDHQDPSPIELQTSSLASAGSRSTCPSMVPRTCVAPFFLSDPGALPTAAQRLRVVPEDPAAHVGTDEHLGAHFQRGRGHRTELQLGLWKAGDQAEGMLISVSVEIYLHCDHPIDFCPLQRFVFPCFPPAAPAGNRSWSLVEHPVDYRSHEDSCWTSPHLRVWTSSQVHGQLVIGHKMSVLKSSSSNPCGHRVANPPLGLTLQTPCSFTGVSRKV